MSDLLDTEPSIGVSGYPNKYKRLFYNGEIYVAELERLGREIKKLQDEHRILANNSVKEMVKPPKGWGTLVVKINGSAIQYQIYRDYYEEKKKEEANPVPAPLPQKPKLTRLELMLQVVDSKTLFNSGLLSKEEKKALLDEHILAKAEA